MGTAVIPSDFEIMRTSDVECIGEGIKRGVARLSPAVQAQLQALVTPQALAAAGGFFVAWLVSHAVGIGFVIDAVFLGLGVLAVGVAVFTGIDGSFSSERSPSARATTGTWIAPPATSPAR